MDHCLECGFVYLDLEREDLPAAVRMVADQYPPRLIGTDAPVLRRRPAPSVWSALEYAVHIRDVLQVGRERAAIALTFERPRFEPMRTTDQMLQRRDNEQDPATVATELGRSADALAALFESLSPAEWERTGYSPGPPTALRDLTWIGRHTVHEMVHHLGDISRSIQPTPGSASG